MCIRLQLKSLSLGARLHGRFRGSTGMSQEKKNKPADEKQQPLPSTGEGADSALDVLKKRRGQTPPSDPTLPLTPPPKKP